MTIWVGQSPTIVVTGYETVKQCLIDNSEQVSNRPTTPYFKLYAEERGIIFSNGENWKVQRRLGLKILRNLGLGKKVLEGRIKVEAHQMVEVFLSQKGSAIDPSRCIMNAVGNVMSAVNFGHTYSLKNEDFHRLIDSTNVVVDFAGTLCGQLYDTFPWLMHRLPGPQQAMYKHLHFLKQCMLEEIRQHQQNPSPEPQDVVDYYLEEISKAKNDPSSKINEESLIIVLMDLVLAGFETVTSTIQWALLYMAVHKDVQVKAQKEIDAFVQSIENLKYEDRLNMPYTNAVIHEIQRFTSVGPVSLPRQCSQDFTLLGYLIRKGTTIVPNLASVLTAPKHWKFPDTFNPSNFLDEEGNFQGNKAFIPFSAGPGAVKNLAAENITTTSFTLNWQSPEGNVSGYLIQISGNVNVTGNTTYTTYTPGSLSPGKAYKVVVSAVVGDSTIQGEGSQIVVQTNANSLFITLKYSSSDDNSEVVVINELNRIINQKFSGRNVTVALKQIKKV
ncbi:cytochrome P450 2J2-like isoform X2 [Phyllobates terribilis]